MSACNNEICSRYVLSSQFGMMSTCCTLQNVYCTLITAARLMGQKKIIPCVIFVFSSWKKVDGKYVFLPCYFWTNLLLPCTKLRR